jgi:hypothetical protein
VDDGVSSIVFTAPSDLVGSYTVVAEGRPTGTLIGPAYSTSMATSTPAKGTYGKATKVNVSVTSTPAATGKVRLLSGAKVVGTGTVVAGEASVKIAGTALKPGAHTLTVDYLGAPDVQPSRGTAKVTVAKAASTTKATSKPANVKVDETMARVRVAVASAGFVPAGKVVLKSAGKVVGRGTLINGKVLVTIKKFKTAGAKTVSTTSPRPELTTRPTAVRVTTSPIGKATRSRSTNAQATPDRAVQQTT